jgi:hypothetical protein
VLFFRLGYGHGRFRMVGMHGFSARVGVFSIRFGAESGSAFTVFAEEPLAHRNRHVLINRAGVRLLFAHSEFRKEVENDAGFNF